MVIINFKQKDLNYKDAYLLNDMEYGTFKNSFGDYSSSGYIRASGKRKRDMVLSTQSREHLFFRGVPVLNANIIVFENIEFELESVFSIPQLKDLTDLALRVYTGFKEYEN